MIHGELLPVERTYKIIESICSLLIATTDGGGNIFGDNMRSLLTTQQKLYGGIGDEDGNYTADESEFNITLKLNGHERFSPQGISYFTRKQIYDHHTGSGSVFDQDAICLFIYA